mmetsp:Transcript_63189/g.131425  ORF Transcript_63189/g.131425 Transcript_63189/m.131425 type:complete len:88 (-) Transcript_63189:16-279(-)
MRNFCACARDERKRLGDGDTDRGCDVCNAHAGTAKSLDMTGAPCGGLFVFRGRQVDEWMEGARGVYPFMKAPAHIIAAALRRSEGQK